MTPPTATAPTTRADRLLDLLAERELDSLLVTNLVNVRYLTGFTGSNGACIVSGEERLFLTDFRYVQQAETQVQGFERLRAERDLLGDLAKRLRGRVGFDDAHLSVRAYGKLEEAVAGGVELVPAGGMVEQLREVKDEEELRAIAEAAKLLEAVYEHVCQRGLAGRTEREVALEVERQMSVLGAEGPAFPAIVAAGAHGASPHAEPREVEIPTGTLVVMDLGCRLDGYASDCTRTIATGEVDGAAAEIYQLVLTAQERGLAAVRAGAECRAVDAVARQVIEAGGHGEHFGHGLGHGVGLDVHEGPRLARNAEGELRTGNVVTVEPGVYVPGQVGVRIEDLVAVTDDGCEIFTGFTKSLINAD